MKRLICAALAAALLTPALLTLKARAQDETPPAPPMDDGQPKDTPNGDGHDADHRDSDAHDTGRHDGDRRGGRLKKHLGLSDEQYDKFKDAMKTHMEAEKALGKQMREGMDAVRDAIKNKASDDDVQKALDAVKSAHKAMADEHEKYVDSLSFLTPTQRGKLLLDEMRMMGPAHDRRDGGRRDRDDDRRDD